MNKAYIKMSSADLLKRCSAKLDYLQHVEALLTKKVRLNLAEKRRAALIEAETKKQNSFWRLLFKQDSLATTIKEIPSVQEIVDSLSESQIRSEAYGSRDEAFFAELQAEHQISKINDLMRLANASDEVYLTAEDLKWIE